MAEEAFEDYGSGGWVTTTTTIARLTVFSDSPFGPSTFRRSINRKSGRFARRSMRRAERPEIKISSSNDMNNNGAGASANGTDVSVYLVVLLEPYNKMHTTLDHGQRGNWSCRVGHWWIVRSDEWDDPSHVEDRGGTPGKTMTFQQLGSIKIQVAF